MLLLGQKKKIIASGYPVTGTVIASKALYWLTVNRSAFRIDNTDSSHPHLVYFNYCVNGKEYHGKSFVNWTAPEYQAGQPIKIFIDQNHPEKYALDV
ncbi:MAG: DUF3592 domain-containing protein [Oscillospiraceae bacterium]|jgi:hypothetical protein|nr:DUF3592 domain-containing protein [Oscillospiraceae bacterium]